MNPSVRIIAGRWRGRKISFSGKTVRPTGDRIRETLFNWLAPYLHEARCLDLFAGSGVLGIEALSRGADAVVFVERDSDSSRQLSAQLNMLEAQGGQVVNMRAEKANLGGLGPFNIVFLDPPFDGPELADLCKLLEASGCMSPGARIYFECSKRQQVPELDSRWRVLKEKQAGQVRFGLLEWLPG